MNWQQNRLLRIVASRSTASPTSCYVYEIRVPQQIGIVEMKFILHPWQLMLMIVAGWMNRQQGEVIEYLQAENKVLREKLGKKRILLTDDQRRRLAVKGKILGRKRLREIGSLFSPDTILRWHRRLVAKKWDYSHRRKKTGRPPLAPEVEKLILKFAQENPTWGYDRIAGSLANLGHKVSDQTVANVLKRHGIEPAPDRQTRTSWKTFLKAHWDTIAAIDFTNIEVWTPRGLVTYGLLFAMELHTRRVHFAGFVTNSDGGKSMRRMATNMTDCEDGFLTGKSHVIMDNDTRFSEAFCKILSDVDAKPVKIAPRCPNMNAHMERFFRSLKQECLYRVIFFGEKSLRNAVREYLKHYNAERNHQGMENQLLVSLEKPPDIEAPIETVERLGGMLKHYRRAA